MMREVNDLFLARGNSHRYQIFVRTFIPLQLVICKFQINDETNNDVAKIYLQRILTPSQVVRNNSDDIKLSLKTFLQEVKGCC